MEQAAVEKVVIVGSGIAGLTAAIYASRANLHPLVVEGYEPGGQLTLTSEVENYPGFPEGIGGIDLVGNMRQQAERFGARFVMADVESCDLQQRPFRLQTSDGQTLYTHTLIVASGARARMLGLPAEERYLGRGLSTCATCDGAFFKDKAVIVVGGGDSAMEESTFLTRYASKVYVVHRSEHFRASKIMLERARSKPNLEFILNTRVVDILGDGQKVAAAVLEDVRTGQRREFPIDGIFLAIGHIPNVEWLGGQVRLDPYGYIVAGPGSTETNIPGVFAAGDVADRLYQQAVTAAGTGCMAALDAEEYLTEHGLG
ncbi:MAG: thioredoxin-disulfide reductase [Firmicutes bacterium]|nr:thioredoxin-disulfide reductase [Alicyclobacillaceae bacterium]MCL6497776.1 thioredoxin-disulfide reductase [Bacillota bacterium]